jgi:hypothetical protein
VDLLEDRDESLLAHIRGVGLVPEQANRKVEDPILIVLEELSKRVVASRP